MAVGADEHGGGVLGFYSLVLAPPELYLLPQKTKLLVYLRVDPRDVDLVPGFTRDVTGLGHHGTGDLEVQSRFGEHHEGACGPGADR